VLDLEKIKTAQVKQVDDLKKRVNKLERKRRSRTPGINLFKIGTSRRRSLGEDDTSKQGRNLKQRSRLISGVLFSPDFSIDVASTHESISALLLFGDKRLERTATFQYQRSRSEKVDKSQLLQVGVVLDHLVTKHVVVVVAHQHPMNLESKDSESLEQHEQLNTVSSLVNAVSSSFTTVDPGREREQRNEFESMFGQDNDAYGNKMFTHVSAAGTSYVNLGGSIPINAATLLNADIPNDPLMPDLEDTANLQYIGILKRMTKTS
nr:hypothetical protein [Tanacetum cinerariifolium]